MRVILVMKRNGSCVMRTYNTLTDILYEELQCSYETKPNGKVWISYEDGRNRQIGFGGEKMIVYYLRGAYFDTGLHQTFTRVD